MGYFSKTWVLGWATLGLATFSQAPEFSQQYKQRLGGAINELATVVRQFDEDATSQGLTRQEALDTLKTSQEEFPRKRGTSIAKAINRFENLLSQRQTMEAAGPFMQPVHLLRYPDAKLMAGTLEAYKPGIQLTAEGALWGLLGGGLLGAAGRVPVSAGRRRSRKKREPRVTPNPLSEDEMP